VSGKKQRGKKNTGARMISDELFEHHIDIQSFCDANVVFIIMKYGKWQRRKQFFSAA
jgi:hypothetical protein